MRWTEQTRTLLPSCMVMQYIQSDLKTKLQQNTKERGEESLQHLDLCILITPALTNDCDK